MVKEYEVIGILHRLPIQILHPRVRARWYVLGVELILHLKSGQQSNKNTEVEAEAAGRPCQQKPWLSNKMGAEGRLFGETQPTSHFSQVGMLCTSLTPVL